MIPNSEEEIKFYYDKFERLRSLENIGFVFSNKRTYSYVRKNGEGLEEIFQYVNGTCLYTIRLKDELIDKKEFGSVEELFKFVSPTFPEIPAQKLYTITLEIPARSLLQIEDELGCAWGDTRDLNEYVISIKEKINVNN